MKVLIALSGGVDSSVAAHLLRQSAHEIGGGTLSLTGASTADARQVADHLSIPFYEFHEEEAFEASVISAFEESYIAGETPNPCILCNKLIKFGLLLDHARDLGYSHLATGHYAGIQKDSATGRYLLTRAKDAAKDQTYMLYLLSQEQLAHSLFPLGGFSKQEIRAMAEELGLANANKPDSQDICFIPDGNYVSFMEARRNTPFPKGSFVNESGEFLGEHQGIIRYTVGQRKGLGIAFGRPTFVLGKNAETNQVVLGPEESLFTRRIYAARVNWIACEKPVDGLKATVKTRYSQKEAEAVIRLTETGIMAEFSQPQRAATPGQALVFYDGDIVIGGGTITGGTEG